MNTLSNSYSIACSHYNYLHSAILLYSYSVSFRFIFAFSFIRTFTLILSLKHSLRYIFLIELWQKITYTYYSHACSYSHAYRAFDPDYLLAFPLSENTLYRVNFYVSWMKITPIRVLTINPVSPKGPFGLNFEILKTALFTFEKCIYFKIKCGNNNNNNNNNSNNKTVLLYRTCN